jgi:hypothetical protein
MDDDLPSDLDADATDVAVSQSVSEPYSCRSSDSPPPLDQLLRDGAEDAATENEYIVHRSAEYWAYWTRQAERAWVLIFVYHLRGRGKGDTLEAAAKKIGLPYLTVTEVHKLHDRHIRARIEANLENDMAEKGERFKYPTWRNAVNRATGKVVKTGPRPAEIIEQLEYKLGEAARDKEELLGEVTDLREGSPRLRELERELVDLRDENTNLLEEITKLRQELLDAINEEVISLRAENARLTAELAGKTGSAKRPIPEPATTETKDRTHEGSTEAEAARQLKGLAAYLRDEYRPEMLNREAIKLYAKGVANWLRKIYDEVLGGDSSVPYTGPVHFCDLAHEILLPVDIDIPSYEGQDENTAVLWFDPTAQIPELVVLHLDSSEISVARRTKRGRGRPRTEPIELPRVKRAYDRKPR